MLRQVIFEINIIKEEYRINIDDVSDFIKRFKKINMLLIIFYEYDRNELIIPLDIKLSIDLSKYDYYYFVNSK